MFPAFQCITFTVAACCLLGQGLSFPFISQVQKDGKMDVLCYSSGAVIRLPEQFYSSSLALCHPLSPTTMRRRKMIAFPPPWKARQLKPQMLRWLAWGHGAETARWCRSHPSARLSPLAQPGFPPVKASLLQSEHCSHKGAWQKQTGLPLHCI